MEKDMTKLGTAGLALASVLAITATSVTDASAQWRRHHHGWGPAVGIGAGIAAGALIGSAVAAQPYGYYGEPGYAYAQPGYAYAQPYAYDAGSTYVAPGYYGTYGYRSRGQCFTDEGYGRRTSCDASGR
jgi:hypothetical protein